MLIDTCYYKLEEQEINLQDNFIINNNNDNNILKEARKTWIITHGLETDPEHSLYGGFKVEVDGIGANSGDDNVCGRCNGSAFTAIRKYSSSFANPNLDFKIGCCWNMDLKFVFVALEE